MPNAIGAIANFGDIVTGTTTQNIVGGVMLGTISQNGTGNFSRTITNTNGITMNQDGAGRWIRDDQQQQCEYWHNKLPH